MMPTVMLGILFGVVAALVFAMDAIALLFYDIDGDTGLGVFLLGLVMSFFSCSFFGLVH